MIQPISNETAKLLRTNTPIHVMRNRTLPWDVYFQKQKLYKWYNYILFDVKEKAVSEVLFEITQLVIRIKTEPRLEANI